MISDTAFFAFMMYFMRGGTMDWLLWFLLFYIMCWITIARSARIYIYRQSKYKWERVIPFPLWMHTLMMIFAFFPAYLFADWMGMFGLVIPTIRMLN